MKVLVATTATQGMRSSDFDDCIDGELVWMIEACPTSRRDPDGDCRCGRSFCGMNSNGSTTTAMVREIAGFTRRDYMKALLASFDAQGWCSCCTAVPPADVIDELVDLANGLPPGAVVERRVDYLDVRTRVTS